MLTYNVPIMRWIFLLGCLYPTVGMAQSKTWALQIEGLSTLDQKNFLNNLDFKKQPAQDNNLTSTLASVPADDRLIAHVSSDIQSYLSSIGYYEPHIQCHIQKPSGFWAAFKRPKKQMLCTVAYGPPILIESVSVTIQGSGQKEPALHDLVQHCPLKKGRRFEHAPYEAYKEQLLQKALALGYLEASFSKNQVSIDPILKKASVTLSLSTLKPFYFGAISFSPTPYPEASLKQYLSFKPGDPYHTQALFKLQKNLLDSDLFHQVRVEPEPWTEGSYAVPLKVQLKPKAANRYTFGLGYGTDTGLRERARWEHRRHRFVGHKVELEGKTSQRINQLHMLYHMPFKRPNTDFLRFGSQIVEEKPWDKKYSLRHETSVSALKKREILERKISTRYLSESFRVLPNTPKQHTHFLLPDLDYSWTYPSRIDRPTDQLQEGLRLQLNLQGGSDLLGSTTNIVRGEGKFKGIKKLGDKTRLILRANVGAMDAKDPKKIPLSLRFFTGGDQSVRGFGYQSLGPSEKDPLGNTIVVGGRYLSVGSLELEHTVYKKVGLALFSDAGNAMNHLSTKLFYSLGLGLRLHSALGSVRVDVAQPLVQDRKPRIHLNFGTDF